MTQARMVTKTKLVYTVSFELDGGKVNSTKIADSIRNAVGTVVPKDKRASVRVRMIERNVNRKFKKEP